MYSSQLPPPDEPALAPPPGVTPCFDDPFTLRPYNTLTTVFCAFTTTVLVFARLYTKHFLLRKMTWEDFSCVIGWASLIVFLSIQELVTFHGAGVHQWNVYSDQLSFTKKWNNYGDMIYSISLCATKLSIMLLIKRVFCSTQKDIAYWLTNFLIFANTGFYVAFLIVPAAQCNPRSKIWNTEEPGQCVNVIELYVASATFNFISDLAMLSVPIYLIWRLQMSLRRKIGVCAIFCTGGLACVSSIARLTYNVKLTHTEDYIFVHVQAAMWAMAEISFGLWCSCLIVLPRLYQHFCDITPYTMQGSSTAQDPRSHTVSNGKSKREWVQLEAHAERAKQKFSKEARLGDEEALDQAVDNS